MGDKILIEFETFNFIFDDGKEAWSVSAWAPRFIQPVDNIDTVEEVVKRAKEASVLSRKTISSDGKTIYESVVFDDMQESELNGYLASIGIKKHLEVSIDD